MPVIYIFRKGLAVDLDRAGQAEAVRTIFARYLEAGSVRALADDLDRSGMRTKATRRTSASCDGLG